MITENERIRTISESLEIQTGENHYACIKFKDDTVITFGYSSTEHRKYIERVYAQANVTDPSSETLRKSIYIADVIDDQNGRYLNLVSEMFIGQEASILEYSHQNSFGSLYIPYKEYAVFEKTNGVTCSITSMPEIALSTTIRKALINEQVRKHPTLVAFHANSVIDLRDGKGIVFSNPDVPLTKTKAGKTTITLSTVIQPNSPFAYRSNEDVYLATENNILHSSLIPAEINIGNMTYSKILNDKTPLHTEKYIFGTSEKYYMTTPGAICEAGYKISSDSLIPKIWTFVDLQPNQTNYSFTPLQVDEAKSLFMSTIKESRIAQFYTPLAQGERIKEKDLSEVELRKEQIVSNANKIFETLLRNGTKFYVIQGGLERNLLYNLTKELTK